MSELQAAIQKRRTFAIISHPDAGKTTITEKFLLYSGQIQLAGTVKARKTGRHAVSDWMAMEKQRGISVSTSVMQFAFGDKLFNLLDTPGHADFSEDTYRTLTAVDSALMVIDGAKGVEARTEKLMEICRLRDTPIVTFINKLDRSIREPMALLDEIESVLKLTAVPVTWPIGSGNDFRGVYHLLNDEIILFDRGETKKGEAVQWPIIKPADIKDPDLKAAFENTLEEVELVQGVLPPFDVEAYLRGEQTPVFFGTALGDYGIDTLMQGIADWAPTPRGFETASRHVESIEEKFSGFVFKIQANMDPKHRDRIAFMRIASGTFKKGMRLTHVRTKKTAACHQALLMSADAREQIETAYPGDIIGLQSHGSLQIGDTFSVGEALQFTGIPYFAPELFRKVILKDPLKRKALQKGLQALAEEGAAQVFTQHDGHDVIVGAVGLLQFDVVESRLQHEYGVACQYETAAIHTVRWLSGDDKSQKQLFDKLSHQLAVDGAGYLVYLAPTRAQLELTKTRHETVEFHTTREVSGNVSLMQVR